jgi:hypothetical protein
MSSLSNYLSTNPLMESLVISIDLNGNELAIVLDHPGKAWTEHYSIVAKSGQKTRWFRRLLFTQVVEFGSFERNNLVDISRLQTAIENGSLCVTNSSITNTIGSIDLGQYSIRWTYQGATLFSERELGVESRGSDWRYFDLRSGNSVDFNKPFDLTRV